MRRFTKREKTSRQINPARTNHRDAPSRASPAPNTLAVCIVQVSEYAAHLYLERFKVLHPKNFARWNLHDALDVLQSSLKTEICTSKA